MKNTRGKKKTLFRKKTMKIKNHLSRKVKYNRRKNYAGGAGENIYFVTLPNGNNYGVIPGIAADATTFPTNKFNVAQNASGVYKATEVPSGAAEEPVLLPAGEQPAGETPDQVVVPINEVTTLTTTGGSKKKKLNKKRKSLRKNN